MQRQQMNINATLDSFSNSSGHITLCVVCTFKETSGHACVVVIHPNINNTSNYGTSNLVVKKLNREANEASGCIQQLDISVYHIVSVFPYYGNTLGEFPVLLTLITQSLEEKGTLILYSTLYA